MTEALKKKGEPLYKIWVPSDVAMYAMKLSVDVKDVFDRILEILRYEPGALCREPEVKLTVNKYVVGVSDCPGGSMAMHVSIDELAKVITIDKVMHPVNIVPT